MSPNETTAELKASRSPKMSPANAGCSLSKQMEAKTEPSGYRSLDDGVCGLADTELPSLAFARQLYFDASEFVQLKMEWKSCVQIDYVGRG
eukprot:6208830-Pleurochrysis_carterae.AAC.4